MAGDTDDSARLAAHLVGCPTCSLEFERMRRTADALREALGQGAVAGDLPEDLRERTLAFVREVGRRRGAPASAEQPLLTSPAPSRQDGRRAMRSIGPLARWVAIAAIVVVVAGLTSLVAGIQYQGRLDRQEASLAAQAAALDILSQIDSSTMRLAGAGDVRTVALTAPAGSGASGTLLMSASRNELVVVMNGVAPLPTGTEYRCWVEIAGKRTVVGRMDVGGSLGYWAGWADGLSTWPSGATFGVSAVGPGGSPAGSGPILTGTL